MSQDWPGRPPIGSLALCLLGMVSALVSPGAQGAPITLPRSGELAVPSEGLPEALRARLILATTALLETRYTDAEAAAREVLDQAPDSPDAWQVLGYALANLERYEEAIAALGEAADRYTENAGPLVTQGELYLHLGRREEAQAALERAVAIEPDNWRALESLGRMAQQAGDIEQATHYYEAAVAHSDPDDVGIKPELAAIYLSTGAPAAAQELLSPWAALPRGTPDRVLGLLGRAAADLGDDELALRYLQARMSADATLESFVDLATFHRSRMNFSAAVDVLKTAAAKFPRNALPWNELGRTYGGEGRYEAALEAFNKGLEISPGAPGLLRGARLAEFRLGRLDAAYELADRLAARPGAPASDQLWLGTIEQARGNPEAAVAAYQSAVDTDPGNWVAHNNLASLVTETEPGRALEHARAAAELAGDAEPVRDTLGWALFHSGDVAGALQVFASLTRDAPENVIAAYHHGRVLLALGREAEGRAELRRALQLDSSFSHADDARKRLAE